MINLDAFEFLDLDGDLVRGGWIASGRVIGQTDALEFGDNVVLDAINGAGYLDNDYQIFFNGHCLTGVQNISFDKWQSQGTVRIGTADNLLKGYLQDIGFTEQAAPQNDHQITDMSFAKIVEHILRKHCNAVYDAAANPDGPVFNLNIDQAGSVRVERKNVRKTNNFFARLKEVGGGLKAGEFYHTYFDRRNTFNYQPVPFFQSPTPQAVGTIDDTLIRGQVRVIDNQADQLKRIGQVELTTGASDQTIFNSVFPATLGDGKPFELGSGVFADTQGRSDLQAERLFKWLTRRYTLFVEVDANLALFGDDGNGLDLGQAVNITYDGPADDGGNGVHLQFNNQKFYIYGMKMRYDQRNDIGNMSLRLEIDNG